MRFVHSQQFEGAEPSDQTRSSTMKHNDGKTEVHSVQLYKHTSKNYNKMCNKPSVSQLNSLYNILLAVVISCFLYDCVSLLHHCEHILAHSSLQFMQAGRH